MLGQPQHRLVHPGLHEEGIVLLMTILTLMIPIGGLILFTFQSYQGTNPLHTGCSRTSPSLVLVGFVLWGSSFPFSASYSSQRSQAAAVPLLVFIAMTQTPFVIMSLILLCELTGRAQQSLSCRQLIANGRDAASMLDQAVLQLKEQRHTTCVMHRLPVSNKPGLVCKPELTGRLF